MAYADSVLNGTALKRRWSLPAHSCEGAQSQGTACVATRSPSSHSVQRKYSSVGLSAQSLKRASNVD